MFQRLLHGNTSSEQKFTLPICELAYYMFWLVNYNRNDRRLRNQTP